MRKIETIAVIGAGEAGSKFALIALRAGYCVVLEDVFLETLETATAYIKRLLNERAIGNGPAMLQRELVLARLSTATRVEDACRLADMLIDTVTDEMEAKLEIFTIFDKFAKPAAILASSTSLSITGIASITSRPEDCVGMRLIGIAAGGERLEIVRGAKTSDETIEGCVAFGQKMCLEVRVENDSFEDAPGNDA